MSPFKKLFVILNPVSGRGKGEKLRDEIRALLQKPGVELMWSETERSGHAIELARSVPPDVDCVIAVGGDGTANEVVNGLMGKPVTLGLVPVGTGNDFARALGIPFHHRKAIEILWRGDVKSVDVGLVNGRYFPNALGLGFDADVVRESQNIRLLRGILVYLVGVFKTIFKYDPYRVHIRMNDRTLDKEILIMTVANGISVGGGFMLTPNAKNDDGWFDVCIIEKLSKPLIFWHLPKVFWGGHVKMKQTSMYRAKHVVIEAKTRLDAHVDGELVEMVDHYYEARILPSALKVVYNAGSNAKN